MAEVSTRLLSDMREFLRRVDDFGRLSGGEMNRKYGANPHEGYEWLAKQGRALAKRLEQRTMEATHDR